MTEVDPFGIFFTTSGSRGDRLLFRYPFEVIPEKTEVEKKPNANPYAVEVLEDYTIPRKRYQTYLHDGQVVGFDNNVLASILNPRKDLCNHNFEVKIEDVLFCGFPVLLYGKDSTSVKSFHISFALQGRVRPVVIDQYQRLSRQLAIALQHEQKRCNYLDHQKSLLQATLDDQASVTPDEKRESPFATMLKQYSLAQELYSVYKNLKQLGTVQVYINNWTPVSFCLPYKVHQTSLPDGVQFKVDPDSLHQSLCHLKPYHGVVLLTDETKLRNALPLDSSHALQRLLTVISPLKNIQQLAADSDLAVPQVLKLVRHLVYWGHATVIYPLCETNVYVLSPHANIASHSRLTEKFSEQFAGYSLQQTLADFSLPLSLREHQDFLSLPQEQVALVQLVVWLLKHKLIMQLHTYVYLLQTPTVQAKFKPLVDLTPQNVLSAISSRRHRNTTWPPAGMPSPQPITSSVGSATSRSSLGSSSQDSDNLETLDETQIREKALEPLPHDLRNLVDSVPSSHNIDDLRLFVRLYPYFNGLYHVEEIMYKENIPRSDILMIIDKFRKILVTCMHEDTEITEKPI